MRCGCLLLLLIILPLVVAVAAYVALPSVRCAALSVLLPRTWKHQDRRFTVNELRSDGLIARDDQVQATIPAGRAAAIAGCFWQGWFLRAGSLAGCAAVGSFEVNDLGAGARPWQLLITDDQSGSTHPPRLVLRPPLADLNRAVARALTNNGKRRSPVSRCTLTRVHVRSVDAPTPDAVDRTFTVDAAGELVCAGLNQAESIPVRNLVATVRVHLALDDDGFRPSASITIVTLDSPAFDLPLLGAQARKLVIPMLEDAANQALARELANARLPGWFPTDLALEGEAR